MAYTFHESREAGIDGYEMNIDGKQSQQTADVECLLRLRCVVARVGEMDLAKWWNTQGQLGSLGSSVLQRGFRRTHHFAQARSVFAVAANRCGEIYDPPGAVTLWDLPAEVEDEFDLRWEQWLDDAEEWGSFFKDLESCSADLESELTRFGLVNADQAARAKSLRRSAEQRAVHLSGEFTGSSDDLAMLALAFSRSEEGNLAVPFQSWDQSK